MNTGPMAFMRGLTFPGGQQPVIKGNGVYLRYPRVVDYAAWSRLRGESKAFLSPIRVRTWPSLPVDCSLSPLGPSPPLLIACNLLITVMFSCGNRLEIEPSRLDRRSSEG